MKEMQEQGQYLDCAYLSDILKIRCFSKNFEDERE